MIVSKIWSKILIRIIGVSLLLKKPLKFHNKQEKGEFKSEVNIQESLK